MKVQIILLLGVTLALFSCNREDTSTLDPQNKRDEIPFTGIWKRQFEPVTGSTHTAKYYIHQDSVRYTLVGDVGQADYTIIRDTFLLDKNRFIGHTNTNKHYLIFVKNKNNNSLVLYKQEVANLAEGMSIEVPNDSTTANHGWNTYYKNEL